jgi:hypothetical protein
MACIQKHHSVLLDWVTNMDDSTSPNDVQKGEEGCEKQFVNSVRYPNHTTASPQLLLPCFIICHHLFSNVSFLKTEQLKIIRTTEARVEYPCILNLRNRWRWVVSFIPWSLFFPHEKSLQYHWIGGWVGPSASQPLPVIKPSFLSHSAYSWSL